MLPFHPLRWIRRRERPTVAAAQTLEKALAAIDAAVEALSEMPGHAATAYALGEARMYFAEAAREHAEPVDPRIYAYICDLLARSAVADGNRNAKPLTKAEQAHQANIRC